MFLSSNGVPPGWSVQVHPNGARSYVHEQKITQALRHVSSTPLMSLGCVSMLQVITDANLVIPEQFQFLTECLDNIVSYIHDNQIPIPPKFDLVLCFRPSQPHPDAPLIGVYYCVYHAHHSIFWLDSFKLSTHLQGDMKHFYTDEPSHIAHAIENLYWSVLPACLLSLLIIWWMMVARFHCCLFPASLTITDNAIEEANDFLVYCLQSGVIKASDMILILTTFFQR